MENLQVYYVSDRVEEVELYNADVVLIKSQNEEVSVVKNKTSHSLDYLYSLVKEVGQDNLPFKVFYLKRTSEN